MGRPTHPTPGNRSFTTGALTLALALAGCAGNDDTRALTGASTGGLTGATSGLSTATTDPGATGPGATTGATDVASTSGGIEATTSDTTGNGTTGAPGTGTTGGTTGDTTSDTAGPPAECVTLDLGGPFTSTVDNPGFGFELPLEPDTPYRRLTVNLTVTPKDWGGQCYNPYYDPPKLVPVFHLFLQIQRGSHWCKGGDLGALVLRGPGSNRMIGEVHYRETPWGGSGCGPEIVPHEIFGGEKNLTIPAGETRAVTYVHDAEAGVIDLNVGDAMFSGTSQPGTDLRALAGHPLYLVLSRGKWLECYDAQGNMDPNAVCCHGPSIGWVYDAVTVELCK